MFFREKFDHLNGKEHLNHQVASSRQRDCLSVCYFDMDTRGKHAQGMN